MIKDKPLLTIRRHFQRPDPVKTAPLAGAMTGHIVDSMTGRGALDYRIKPVDPLNSRFCGPALTVQCSPGDNLGVLAALDVAQPGDVILVATDSFTETAVVGDLVVGMMANIGVVGFATDGLVRDVAGIKPTGVPVFCAGVTPNSPTGAAQGSVGLPIVIGGVAVEAGDLVIADEDGVVIVPQGEIEAMMAELAEVRALEAEVEAKVKAGQKTSPKIDALKQAGRVLEV